MSEQTPSNDNVREAAGNILDDLASLAGTLATLLRSEAAVSPHTVAALLIHAERQVRQLIRDQQRMSDGDG
jgi:hypothetical protein